MADVPRSPEPPAECPNCHAVRTGRYCAACGQDSAHMELRARALVAEGFRNIFGWDGAAPRTARALVRRPGDLAAAYVRGERRRHLNPARFCFVAVALWVLLGRALDLDPISQTGFDVRATDGADGERIKAFRQKLQAHMDLFLFASLPIRAAAYRLLFRKSEYTVAACLVLVLYVAGLSFFLGSALMVAEWATGVEGVARLRIVIGFVISVLAARQFFDTGVWAATWRVIVATLLHAAGTVVVAAAVVLPFFL